MSFTAESLLKSFGVQNTKIGQGLIGLNKEEGKFQNQLYVLGVLFIALIFGIVAVALFSTGVSDLESYGDYFKSTGHKVAIGFAAATLITLIIAAVMLDSSLECAEQTRARATAPNRSPPMPNIIGSVPQAQYPTYRTPSPPPSNRQPIYRQPAQPIYRQPVQPIYRQQPPPTYQRPPQPPRVPLPIAYPQVPTAAPQAIAYPQVPTTAPQAIAYPPIPSATPQAIAYPQAVQAQPQSLVTSFATALPSLINVAAPIALAAANAQQGQRGVAALNAAAVPLQ